jgi:hypothetical protein
MASFYVPNTSDDVLCRHFEREAVYLSYKLVHELAGNKTRIYNTVDMEAAHYPQPASSTPNRSYYSMWPHSGQPCLESSQELSSGLHINEVQIQ